MVQLSGAAADGHAEDPHLRWMLATHIHCGEVMQLVVPDQSPSREGPLETNDGGPRTYRCACGFSFDRTED